METVKKSGTLSEISCPRLLARLHRNRFDGTLRLSRGALLKLLYFQGGEIAMASSNDQADHLAPILIRAGKLKPEQMDLARKSTRPGVSLARVLVQMGFLTSGELFAGARQQLRQIVGSVLPLTDAGYETQEGFFPREITSLNVDTRELLLDLIRDLTDRSFVLLEVGAPDTVYVPATGGNGADTAPLPRRWKELIDHFPHPMAIRDFGQAAGLDDFSASKIVYGLSLLGRLTPEHPPVEETPEAAAVAVSEDAEAMLSAARPSPEPYPSEASSGAEPIRVVSIRDDPEDAEAPMSDVVAPPEPSRRDPLPPPLTSHPAASSIRDMPAESAFSMSASSAQDEQGAASASSAEEETAPEAPHPAAASFPLEPIGEEVPILRTAHLPRSEPSRPWTVLSILSGVVLLALISYWFVFLRAPARASDTAGVSETAPPSETAAPEASPEDVSSAPSGTPQEATAQAQTPPSGATDAAPSAETSEPGAGTPESAPVETSPATPVETTAPHPASSAASPPVPAASPASSPGVEAPRAGAVTSAAWAKARAQLDAGEHAAAARSFSQALRPHAESFTLQIAIACQEESLRKAARGTHPDDPFFVTPFLLQGRSCFRLCFGFYPSIDQAERAAAAIPPVLAEGGIHPVVIALRRITATEGN
ncbi:MAG TPA: DUF4388 domain-containing protein [Candidatus Polarisedimenticolia bacterium]|nr:DUF4388 domain-containing protein [Candidatus Polarisedimenticolia bacterium]